MGYHANIEIHLHRDSHHCFDLAVYILFGLMLMTYDDFYDASKGEYWSLESMTPAQQAMYIGLHVWHGVNVLGILYLIYWLVKKYKVVAGQYPG